jgi:hypothetical protein
LIKNSSTAIHKYDYILVIFLLFIQMIVIILFFDPKMHVGGDDSDYIIAAHEFWKGEKFPSWHGSFYPIFLSIFTPLFQFKIIAYKVLSVLLAIFHFIFIYKAFTSRLPRYLVLFVLVVTAFNWQLAFYSSTTYSEVLFMFLQAAFLYVFFTLEAKMSSEKIKSLLPLWVLLGLLIFLLSITRNNGIGAIITLSLYLLIHKKWKECLLLAGIFIGFEIVFILYKNFYWKVSGAGFEEQLQRIVNKDFYDPNKGNEDLKGFIKRFYINSLDYLSRHLAVIFGLRKSQSMETLRPLNSLMAMFYSIFLLSAWVSFKKNKAVFLVSIYVFIMLGITFITMQTQWSQERLILIYLPLIAMMIGYLIHEMTINRSPALKITGKVVLVFIALMVAGSMIGSPKNIDNAISNLSSDRNRFKGYDDEWKNYVELSEWIGKNIDPSSQVLCRKPSLSSVYGKRTFAGIARFNYTEADSAVSFIEKKKIDYVILDKLALETVQRLMKYYLMKRPLGIKLIKEVGQSKSALLLKICRDDPADDNDHIARLLTGIRVFPTNAYFYVLIGDKLSSMQKMDQALSYYDQGYKLESANFHILARRGWAYYLTGNYKRSYQDVSAAVKAHPENLEYANLLSDIKKRL